MDAEGHPANEDEEHHHNYHNPDEEEDYEETDDENIDEEQVIDVAERIFIRIAEALQTQGVTSIRQTFKDHIFETTELSGQVLELISPEGFIQGIASIGVDDLTD